MRNGYKVVWEKRQRRRGSDQHKGAFRKKSGGLSGGAIAAIVICSVIALAIVGVIVAMAKSGKLGSQNPQQSDYSLRTNSSVNHFAVAGQNQY